MRTIILATYWDAVVALWVLAKTENEKNPYIFRQNKLQKVWITDFYTKMWGFFDVNLYWFVVKLIYKTKKIKGGRRWKIKLLLLLLQQRYF